MVRQSQMKIVAVRVPAFDSLDEVYPVDANRPHMPVEPNAVQLGDFILVLERRHFGFAAAVDDMDLPAPV